MGCVVVAHAALDAAPSPPPPEPCRAVPSAAPPAHGVLKVHDAPCLALCGPLLARARRGTAWGAPGKIAAVQEAMWRRLALTRAALQALLVELVDPLAAAGAEASRVTAAAAKDMSAQAVAQWILSHQLAVWADAMEAAATSGCDPKTFTFLQAPEGRPQGDEPARPSLPIYHALRASHALDSDSLFDALPPRFIRTCLSSNDALGVADTYAELLDGGVTRVRPRIDATSFRLGHDGAAVAHNTLRVSVVAELCGEVVASIQPSDVVVTLTRGRLTRCTLIAPGVIEYGFVVDAPSRAGSHPTPVDVSAALFGMEGTRASARIPACPALLTHGAVLPCVPPTICQAFLAQLTTWLPCASYTLRYRGTRDGLTAAAFHAACDGKGPSLTLVRSACGWVFGGYTAAQWGGVEGPRSDPHAFLFSVTSPCGNVVRYPVQDPVAAVYCHPLMGPAFGVPSRRGGCDFVLASSNGKADGVFSDASGCGIGGGFVDAIGLGARSLTGTPRFEPLEVEVFGVVWL